MYIHGNGMSCPMVCLHSCYRYPMDATEVVVGEYAQHEVGASEMKHRLKAIYVVSMSNY